MKSTERTTGLIVRTRVLTETSLIVHWLTADAGRIATVARGARRFKSPFRGKLDLFHEAELTFQRSRRSELHLLSEVAVRQTYSFLRTDWRRLNQAAYAVALIEQTTEMDTPLPEAWELLRGFLKVLETGPASAAVVATLELKHLADLGQFPELEGQSLPEPSRRLARSLAAGSWESANQPVDEAVIRPLIQFLHGFLSFELGRLPRGRMEALGGAGAVKRRTDRSKELGEGS